MKKKYIFLFGLVVFFTICLTVKYLTFPEYQTSFDFNYLNNNEIINYTETLLLDNKVPKENINLWLEYVKKYNSKNKHVRKSTANGWTSIRLGSYNEIDFTNNLNNWSDEEENFLDLNCRVSTFLLLRNMVSSEYCSKGQDSYTEKEISKIKNIYNENFSNEDSTTYRSLFAPIEFNIDKSKDIDIYSETLKKLNQYWEKENLVFKSNNPSLIQVVFIEPNSSRIKATIGHVGVLIKDYNKIYFIEKKNPFFPYQVSRFKEIKDLNYYILTSYQKNSDSKNCKLMILQNDNPIFKHDI
ncbi:DUF4300 family protein [Paraclostridium sordellii]|uniref:DUF4300 family protein n=1 Tax=Paraclostridium sordellii TaxID=1505 RepID=UPI0005E9BE23|nr:DUF4300 family protein [Paeniclostridium sordellii]CEN81181.1 membrane associated lipoprotein [[Clostridium] sordellii] [Paeniclostridium sordellii]